MTADANPSKVIMPCVVWAVKFGVSELMRHPMSSR